MGWEWREEGTREPGSQEAREPETWWVSKRKKKGLSSSTGAVNKTLLKTIKEWQCKYVIWENGENWWKGSANGVKQSCHLAVGRLRWESCKLQWCPVSIYNYKLVPKETQVGNGERAVLDSWRPPATHLRVCGTLSVVVYSMCLKWNTTA